MSTSVALVALKTNLISEKLDALVGSFGLFMSAFSILSGIDIIKATTKIAMSKENINRELDSESAELKEEKVKKIGKKIFKR